MPTFNGAGFLKDNGLELVDAGSGEGMVRVRDQSGQEGELDLKKMLADSGTDTKELSFEYNTPDNAINRSPVSIGDRLKLSFGNAEGQMAYLKKNFKNSILDADGDLKINDKGVWYNLDPRALGDGSGWDLAKELVGDAADLAGNIPALAGQLVGAAAGSAVAPVAGTIGGSAVGGGIGAGAKIALGRVLGTYEATPAEMAKDVALDAILSAGGESVGLGARQMILPGAKKALAAISEKGSAQVKNTIAAIAQQFGGASEVGAYRLAEAAPEVMGMVDSIVASAGNSATADVVRERAQQTAVNTLKPLLSDAQRRLSSKYLADQAKVIESVADDAVIDAIEPAKAALSGIAELGVLKPLVGPSTKTGAIRYVPADAETIAKQFGLGSLKVAEDLGKKLGSFANSAQSILSGSEAQPLGKAAASQSLEMTRLLRDLQSTIKSTNPDVGRIMGDLASSVGSQVRNSLPMESRLLAGAMDSYYATHKPIVEIAQRAIDSAADMGVENMVNELRRGPSGALRTVLNSLSERAPGGEALKTNVMNAVAAEDFLNWLPKGSISLSEARANIIPPRILGKGISAGHRTMSAFSSTLKSLSTNARLQALQDGQLWEGALGEAMRSFNGEGQ